MALDTSIDAVRSYFIEGRARPIALGNSGQLLSCSRGPALLAALLSTLLFALLSALVAVQTLSAKLLASLTECRAAVRILRRQANIA